MRLEEIMTSPALTIDLDASAAEARQLMRLEHVRHLVVTDRGKAVGVVSRHDLGSEEGKAVGELLSHALVTATPATTVREAANLLRGRDVRCLPILQGKKLVGVVSVTDLLELIGKGVDRPVPHTTRWTLRHRGPRRKVSPRAEKRAP